MARSLNGFESMSDPVLAYTASQIKTKVEGNVNFATPVPALTVLQAAIDAFEAELELGQGSTYGSALKNEKRNELIDVLHSLGRYVDFTANGDAVIILSAGYSVTKPYAPKPPVQGITNLQLKDGPNAGEVALSFDRAANATAYLYQFTPDPAMGASTWQTQPGTTSKNTIANLQSGVAYWFRVVALGVNDQSVTSLPVKRIVQ
jgi:hypothetical protein